MGFQEVAATNALEACNGISDIKLFRGNGKMFLQNDLGLKLNAAMQSHIRSGKGGEKLAVAASKATWTKQPSCYSRPSLRATGKVL